MGETTPQNPIAGTLDDLDALGSGEGRSGTVFDPQAEGQERTVVDPAAMTTSAPAANEPRRALTPKPDAATLALPAGFRLHEYRIDRVLGQGGFGIAYAATDV